MRLFWRVFLINGGLLVAAALALALSPLTVSAPIAAVEAAALTVGLVLVLIANYVLLRPTFHSLEQLSVEMRDADLLHPGRRLPVAGTAEIAELMHSFNAMRDRLQAERRESGHRALAAQESERARIASELHDEVGQSLTALLLLLKRIGDEVPADRRETFVGAQQAVRASLDEVRRIAQELRPEMLEHLGLVSALKALSRGFSDRTGVAVHWSFASELPPLPADAELALFRIAQESLTNVARHAGASMVRLELTSGSNSVVLRILDDGRGFNGLPPSRNAGLRGMRERAVVIGAALAVKPAATGGVEVRLEIPAQPIAGDECRSH